MEDWGAVRERLVRLCELSAKDVPCQDDIRAALDRITELEEELIEARVAAVERDELEAKLARCAEALGEIRGRSLAAKTHEVGPLEAKGRLTRILELACAALAAARGGE